MAINYGKAAIKNGAPCYMYNFARDLPGDDIGAWHACDLLYAFDTLDFNWRPFDETDRRISNEMIESFAAFVKTGNPNCDAIPKWESGYKMPLRFCEHTEMAPWLTKDMIKNTVNNKGPI